MNNTIASEKQLINKYRKIMSTIADADKRTKRAI